MESRINLFLLSNSQLVELKSNLCSKLVKLWTINFQNMPSWGIQIEIKDQLFRKVLSSLLSLSSVLARLESIRTYRKLYKNHVYNQIRGHHKGSIKIHNVNKLPIFEAIKYIKILVYQHLKHTFTRFCGSWLYLLFAHRSFYQVTKALSASAWTKSNQTWPTWKVKYTNRTTKYQICTILEEKSNFAPEKNIFEIFAFDFRFFALDGLVGQK